MPTKKVKKVASKVAKKVGSSSSNSKAHHIDEKKQFGVLVLLALIGAVVVLYIVMVMRFPAMSQKYTPDSSMPAGFTKGDFVAQLIEQNNSNQYGNVILKDINGQTEVTILLNNMPGGVSQPAYVSVGSCIDTGAIQYTLNNVVNGRSITRINADLLDLNRKSPLSVSVRSQSRLDRKVSCANLPL